MDKKLLKAYIRTIVEEEVERLLPKMLEEAVGEIKRAKGSSINESSSSSQKSPLDRSRLAELMGLDYNRETGTLSAGNVSSAPSRVDAGSGMVTAIDSQGNKIAIPKDRVPEEVLDAVNRDYSQLMKKLKL